MIHDEPFTLPCLLQVRLIKELYGNQIRELYHSLPYHMIEFALDDSDWLVHDLIGIAPSLVMVGGVQMFTDLDRMLFLVAAR